MFLQLTNNYPWVERYFFANAEGCLVVVVCLKASLAIGGLFYDLAILIAT